MLNWAIPWNGDVAHLIEQPYEVLATALCGASPAPAPAVTGAPRQWWLPNHQVRIACVYCKLEAEGRHLLLPSWTFSQAVPVIAPPLPEELRFPAAALDDERVCDGDPAPLRVRLRFPAPSGGTTTEVILGPRDIVRTQFDRQPQQDEVVAVGRWESGSFSTYWEGPLSQLLWHGPTPFHGQHTWNYLRPTEWHGPIRCTQCGLCHLPAPGDRVPCVLCWGRHPFGRPVTTHGRWRGVPYQGAPFHWPSERTTVVTSGQWRGRDPLQCRTTETHEYAFPPIYDQPYHRYLRDCSRCGIVIALDAAAASWQPEPPPDVLLNPCPGCGVLHTLAELHTESFIMTQLTAEQMGTLELTPELRRILTLDSAAHEYEATNERLLNNRREFVEALVELWCREIPDPTLRFTLRSSIPVIVQFMADNPHRSTEPQLREYFVPAQYRQEQQNQPQVQESSSTFNLNLASAFIEQWCSGLTDETARVRLRATRELLASYLANHPNMAERTLHENWVGPILRTTVPNYPHELVTPEPTTPLCACGCGQHVKKAQSKYCAGHNTAGYHAQRRRERVS